MAAAVIPRLDGHELARAFMAGIGRVLREQERLDRINVFPVPDGDTGTNLAITMTSVLAALRAAPAAHAGQLLTRVADAALDGARGNSGAILAQFLLGVGDRSQHLAALAPRDFAEAVQGGARYAREALAEPREGTILTVLQEVADELAARVAAGADDFRALTGAALVRAEASLRATRDQLESLRRADVVDAGAAGFVALFGGLTEYLATGELDEGALLAAARHDEPQPALGETGALDHRWCTECTVTGEALDHRLLRERLAGLGSSLVVAGTRGKARVHVHVDEPGRVFAAVAGFGLVTGQKADDMRRQQEAAHGGARRRRVAVVTDSAADLPDSELERLDLHLVPVRVHFGERSYLDKVGLSADEFYRLLASSAVPPKTSQPPPGDFRRLFEFLASHYESVVCVNVTGTASGTRQAAESAAARVAARDRVLVIDSANASAGQGLLAMYAAECADAGMDAAAVAAAVRGMVPRTRTWGCLATLDYAVRGGRVPAFARPLARALGARVVIANRADGRIGLAGALLGRGDVAVRFARWVRRRLAPGRRWRVICGHANAPEDGARLLAALTDGLECVDGAWLVPLGTALGAHGGPGMLVVGLQDYEPPRAAGGGASRNPT